MNHLKRIVLVVLLALGISSAFPAEDPAVLLEKGIYTEETLGNLSEAIGIYQKVVTAAGATRATSATALFRLGMCYQKMNRTADAQAAFSKLEKQYPEQLGLISKIPGVPSKGLDARRVPWVDGEELQFVDKEGNTKAIYRTTSAKSNGKTVWRFQTLTLRGYPLSGYLYSRIYMNASNLMPISSLLIGYSDIRSDRFTIGGRTRTQINYTPGVIEVSKGYDPDGSPVSGKNLLALEREAYDYNSDQFEMIIRTLPLREGFQTVIPMLSQSWVDNTAVKETVSPIDTIKVSVPAREKIIVPAGAFDCYKVVKSWNTGAAIVYWISADEHAYLVKVEGRSGGDKELKSIKNSDKNQPVILDDRELGIKISTPSQWYIGRHSGDSRILLTEPEVEVKGVLSISSDQPTSLSLDEAQNKDFESNKLKLPGYVYRPESRTTTTVSGVPAISYIADFNQSDTRGKGVERGYFFIKSNKAYRLVFQVDAKLFESMKSDFDSIATSIVVR
jgi:hypothetical protein